jgi:transaldolase
MKDDNPLKAAQKLGQSIWLDDIHRGMLNNGDFQGYIDNDGISGVTSNPAILKKAILDHDDYDTDIAQLAAENSDARAAYEHLVIADLQQAADLLRPQYENSQARDGFVSMEVSPHYAHDTELTITAARRLWKILDRPNVMIKIPATVEGLNAIQTLTAEGININATLLFSISRYQLVAEAYIAGITERHNRRLPVDNVASVASFFLSRIDVKIDKALSSLDAESEFRGRAAIASSRLAYQVYKQLFSGSEWQELVDEGAQPQRLLWASTSTKDPSYKDVMYVESLIGADTVNTLPLKTLNAFRDHGQAALRVEKELEESAALLKQIADLGINMEDITQQLEDEGLEKFIKPFDVLLETLKSKLVTIKPDTTN